MTESNILIAILVVLFIILILLIIVFYNNLFCNKQQSKEKAREGKPFARKYLDIPPMEFSESKSTSNNENSNIQTIKQKSVEDLKIKNYDSLGFEVKSNSLLYVFDLIKSQ